MSYNVRLVASPPWRTWLRWFRDTGSASSRPDAEDTDRPAARRDRGFTVVETLVSMSIVTLVLFPVARGAITASSASSLAKEHSVATGLISGDVSQLVALPFASVEEGLNPSVDSALCTDPNIACAINGGTTTYTLKATGATIPTANTSTSQAPLVPYITHTTVGITYRIATYPTVSSSTPGLVTVAVIVSWTGPNGTAASAVGETELALP